MKGNIVFDSLEEKILNTGCLGSVMYLGVFIVGLSLMVVFPWLGIVFLLAIFLNFLSGKMRGGSSRKKVEAKSVPVSKKQSTLSKEEMLAKKEQRKNHRKEQAEQQRLQSKAVRQGLIDRNEDLIGKFFEAAERKVSILDDYGDENWSILPNEIETCLKKIAEREGVEIYAMGKSTLMDTLPGEYEWLESELANAFSRYHKDRKTFSTKFDQEKIDGMLGVEFETYIANILKEYGFEDVRGTPTTGDQGADLLARKNGRDIIIQAKRWGGVVGNKAVQEVIGAIQFYGGDEGWVVTNSRFTPSAKALAQKSGVKLIDGSDLNRIGDLLS